MSVTIDDFFKDSYTQSAFYQSFRAIASYVDGLKPSSRKVVYTVKKLNLRDPMKVSRLASRISEETEYLHGEGSLEGVIVNLAQDFVGANNVNLLLPEGNFGSRHIPSAAASRYIFTKGSPALDSMFHEGDDDLLVKQEFEGSQIEPRFFVPVLPILLINGSEGVGNGYAQNILPRNPEELKAEIKKMIKDPSYVPKKLTPWFRGFNGTVFSEGTGWVIRGKLERINTTKLMVTELPVGYNLSKYREILDKLVEEKKIKDFEDKSENDQFRFEISCTREFSAQSDEKIYSILKLEKRDTENFTVIDESNKIRVYDNDSDILRDFFKLRMEYYLKRKVAAIAQAEDECSILFDRCKFIGMILQKTLIIERRTKDQIETDLEANNFRKVDGEYDYLLRMPLYSLTQEKIDELSKSLEKKRKELDILKSKTPADLWKADLEK